MKMTETLKNRHRNRRKLHAQKEKGMKIPFAGNSNTPLLRNAAVVVVVVVTTAASSQTVSGFSTSGIISNGPRIKNNRYYSSENNWQSIYGRRSWVTLFSGDGQPSLSVNAVDGEKKKKEDITTTTPNGEHGGSIDNKNEGTHVGDSSAPLLTDKRKDYNESDAAGPNTEEEEESTITKNWFRPYDDEEDFEMDVSMSPESQVKAEESFFEIDEECEGEMCLIPDHDDGVFLNDKKSARSNNGSLSKVDRSTQMVDDAIRYIPIVAPVLAFFTYEKLARIFDTVVELVSDTLLTDKNWVAVDGGAYQSQIIAPAINGIVVPSIAILFATLISNTVTTLRQRQLDIRTTLNTEASELRVLQAMVDVFPTTPPLYDRAQDKCRAYLIQYATRLIAESQPGVQISSLEFRGSLDSEMNGFLAQLNEMNVAAARAAAVAESKCSVGGGGSSNMGSMDTTNDGRVNNCNNNDIEMIATLLPPSILSESYSAVSRLNAERSMRISALQSTFPALHYVILAMLAGSICVAFLIETNQEFLIFLNAIQLRILWTMLIGTFSALGVVCFDLVDPFRGNYEISRSVDQLYTIRDALRASDKMKNSSKNKV